MGVTDHNASYIDLAARLRRAYRGTPVDSLRDGLHPTDAEGAYSVQAINTAWWLESGRCIAGWKVGLTSEVVQRQLGVDQPDFGVLFDDMQLESGGALDMSLLIQPRAEAEVALVLGQDLNRDDVGPEDVAAATEWVIPAIEIVDSRIRDWKIAFADTVADNGSSAMFVLGEERHAVAGLDLYTCGMVLEVNGAVASLGAGAACLGHPLNAAAWLARTLAQRGQRLRSGQVVLTGALGPMVDLSPGDHLRAKIAGLGEVTLSCSEVTE